MEHFDLIETAIDFVYNAIPYVVRETLGLAVFAWIVFHTLLNVI